MGAPLPSSTLFTRPALHGRGLGGSEDPGGRGSMPLRRPPVSGAALPKEWHRQGVRCGFGENASLDGGVRSAQVAVLGARQERRPNTKIRGGPSMLDEETCGD
jgi:hypothetical protein